MQIMQIIKKKKKCTNIEFQVNFLKYLTFIARHIYNGRTFRINFDHFSGLPKMVEKSKNFQMFIFLRKVFFLIFKKKSIFKKYYYEINGFAEQGIL